MAEVLPDEEAYWLYHTFGYPLNKAYTEPIAHLLVKHKTDLVPQIIDAVGKEYVAFFKTLRTLFYTVITTTPDLNAVRDIVMVAGESSDAVFYGLDPLIKIFLSDKTALPYLAEIARTKKQLFFYAFRSVTHIVSSRNFNEICEYFLSIKTLAAQSEVPNFFLDATFMDSISHLINSVNDIIPVGYALVSAYKEGFLTRSRRGYFSSTAKNKLSLPVFIAGFREFFIRDFDRVTAEQFARGLFAAGLFLRKARPQKAQLNLLKRAA